MNTRGAWLVFSSALSCVAAIAACGSRTGLLPSGGGSGNSSGSSGGSGDGGSSGGDGSSSDAPPFDGQYLDAIRPFDAARGCPDAGATFIYVVTQQGALMSFYPTAAAFTPIGTIVCSDASIFGPVSMGVRRSDGIAYVLFDDGNVYRVSMLTASCQPTGFSTAFEGDAAIGDSGVPVFHGMYGMGYASGPGGAGEALYVASSPFDSFGNATPSSLGVLDTSAFAIKPVAQFTPSIIEPELAGNDNGKLFAFYPTPDLSGALLGEVDPTTAQITPMMPLPGVAIGASWTFASWEGDFYLFTAASGGATVVQRYRPSDGSITTVATTSVVIVGAGTATCAPAP